MSLTPRDVERFWALVQTAKSRGCWHFGRRKSARSYGAFTTSIDGQPKRAHPAHRIAYLLAYGHIDASLDIDHLCNTPSCVRPSHLQLVSRSENIRRARSWGLFSRPGICCKYGHSSKKYRKETKKIVNGKTKTSSKCMKCVSNKSRALRKAASIVRHGTEFYDKSTSYKLFCSKGHRRHRDSVIIETSGAVRCRICRNETASSSGIRRRRSKGIGPKLKPTCSKGHFYTAESTLQYQSGRKCRICREEAKAKDLKQKKEIYDTYKAMPTQTGSRTNQRTTKDVRKI